MSEFRLCRTCRHFRWGLGTTKRCSKCEHTFSGWEPERIPFSDAELLGCDDLALLDRDELTRLVVLLRQSPQPQPAATGPACESCGDGGLVCVSCPGGAR